MLCTTVKIGNGYKVFMMVNGGHYVTSPRGEQVVYPMIHQALNKIADMNATWVQHAGLYRGCDLLTDVNGNVYIVSDDQRVFCDYNLKRLEDARTLIDHHMNVK